MNIPKRRQIFFNQHNCWVDFLNLKDQSLLERRVMSVQINTYRDTAFFQDFKRKNSLSSSLYPNEYTFLIQAQSYMKENLKRMTRENAKTLEDIDSFHLYEELTALMSLIRHEVVVLGEAPFVGSLIRVQDEEKIDSFIPTLARIMYRWLEYLEKYICGEIKEDIFKIGVCQYAKKGEKECGKVFWGKTKKSEACEEHRLKWAKLKYNRKSSSSVDSKERN